MGTGSKDQVDKTQSTGLEGSGPGQNEGKSSNEEERDNLVLQIQSMADAQAALFSDDDFHSDEEVFEAGDDMMVEETVPEPIPQSPQPSDTEATETHSDSESSGDDQAPLTGKFFTKFIKKATNALFRGVTDQVFDMHTEQAVHYFNLKDAVEDFNDDVREQNASVSFSLTQMVSHLNKFLESLNKLNTGVQSIQESVKDDPELTKKLLQASETYQLNSVHLTELLNLMKTFNLQGLSNSVEAFKTSLAALDLLVADQSQNSASLAWSFGSRLTAMENAHASLEAKVSTIQKDTSDIKSMMIEIYQAFKGSSTSASVTPTLAITTAQAIVEGENITDAPHTEAQNEATDVATLRGIMSLRPLQSHHFNHKKNQSFHLVNRIKAKALLQYMNLSEC